VQLSELLGAAVHDTAGDRLGTVVDIRLKITGDLKDHPDRPEIFGVVVSPRTRSSFLGYERSDARRPFLLADFFRWRHRGTFLALWRDVAAVEKSGLSVRVGFTRYSAVLRDDD
jgi:hypothetical protein